MKTYSGPISEVWRALITDVSAPGVGELPGYVAIVTDEPESAADPTRTNLDRLLASKGKSITQTVANTIFPGTLWDPKEPRTSLYRRYESLWPRIRSDPANRHGVYFRRIVHYETSTGPVNQAETVIQNYLSGNHRRSAMQLSIYDAGRDLTNARRRGFPCLQHVVLAPTRGRRLQLTAFYATQTIFDKSYGNLLGLWRLGQFFAHSLDHELDRVVCFASIGLLGGIGRKEAREFI